MLKRVLLSVVVLVIFSSGTFAATVGKHKTPDVLRAGDLSLVLNGAGLRKKLFLTLYVGALYLTETNNQANEIIEGDQPMAIRLQITSSAITAKKMEKAVRKGFKNATDGATAPLQEQIDQFIAVFRKGITRDDTYEMIYLPSAGTEVLKNGQSMVTIPGLAFKQALVGIWLSNRPAQASLKAAMLGEAR